MLPIEEGKVLSIIIKILPSQLTQVNFMITAPNRWIYDCIRIVTLYQQLRMLTFCDLIAICWCQ
jgi:hypothetical protein